jgi:hypothetical protein
MMEQVCPEQKGTGQSKWQATNGTHSLVAG